MAEVEKSESCRRLLAKRMKDGWLEEAPLFDDVTTVGSRILGSIDGIVAGWPCQVTFCTVRIWYGSAWFLGSVCLHLLLPGHEHSWKT